MTVIVDPTFEPSERDTLILSRRDVAELLSLPDCIVAVEQGFRLHAMGQAAAPGVLGHHAKEGGFHVKAASLPLGRPYFAAKVNANFPGNPRRSGLPTIQGIVALYDAENGVPLAVMDSIEITALRTGAATAVAAKQLARPDSHVATICGCGIQGRVQLAALAAVLPLQRAQLFDRDPSQARRMAAELAATMPFPLVPADSLAAALAGSDVCVTCTPSRRYFLDLAAIPPGLFIAAVGADAEDKQELAPELLAAGKVVVDMLDQCAAIGDLHHALAARVMAPAMVHAEIGEIVAGRKPGRTSHDEITIFDSTGTALQDVAAAAVVYENAVRRGKGLRLAIGR